MANAQFPFASGEGMRLKLKCYAFDAASVLSPK
jgi:hypothetical protein